MKKLIKEKHIIIWMILGLIYSVMYILGRLIDEYGYIFWEGKKNFFYLLMGIMVGIALAFIMSHIRIQKKKSKGYYISKKAFCGYMAINYICYFVLLLGVFPGFFLYDAQEELLQVVTRSFNTHHPIVHVLYMGGTIQAGYKLFGNYNAGIFLFFLVQILFFSYANVRIMSFLIKRGTAKAIVILVDLFLLFFPPMEMMVLCSVKDSIFALCAVLWLITFCELEEKKNIKIYAKFILWTLGMCVIRNNAVYAVLVFIFICCIFYRKNKNIIILPILSVLLALALNKSLAFVFNADSVGKQEMLTVPIQQIARLYYYGDDTNGFSANEKEELYRYIPEEFLQCYEPKVSDRVKIGFINEAYNHDKKGFWKIWTKGFKNSPMTYINAWLLTSYGYYYPNATIDAYKGHEVYTFRYDESSYFGYETEEPGERKSFIPVIDSYFKYLSLERVKDESVILAVLLSPGLVAWIYMALFVFMITNRKERNEIPCILFLLIWATLLIGPISIPRYVFYLWYSLPVMLSISNNGVKRGEKY